MKVIKSIIRDETALRERFLPDMQHAGLFVPKAQGLSVGESVCLWIQLRYLTAELHVYGTVFWMRHRSDRHHSRLRTGAGIGFRAQQEEQVAFLNRALKEEVEPFPARRMPRTPLLNPWRCEVNVNGRMSSRPAMLSDISKGGARCVVGALTLQPGQHLVLQIPWHSKTLHTMEVAWRRESDGRNFLGLARQRVDHQSDRDWNELVSRARRLFNSQVWTRSSVPPTS